ncbi:MAG: tetratricopeptide repeat protein [Gemmatimonadetes bacterium]|nr:tetratricopeptide repeat protein [Gemmatimonadota bacterium]
MSLEPPRRSFRDTPKKRGLRDIDGPARGRNFKALAWSLFGGLPMGAAAGFAAGHPMLGLLLGPILVFVLTMGIAGLTGRSVAFFLVPSGSYAPRKTEHSRAEALAVRGDHEAAILVYQGALLEAPEDGEVYLRIARLYRDGVKNPEEAVTWFQRGLREARLSKGQELLARREAAELLIHHMGEPNRAAPELARLAEASPITTTGQWAAKELARIKQEMGREGDDGLSDEGRNTQSKGGPPEKT